MMINPKVDEKTLKALISLKNNVSWVDVRAWLVREAIRLEKRNRYEVDTTILKQTQGALQFIHELLDRQDSSKDSLKKLKK